MAQKQDTLMGHCACVMGVCRRPQVELVSEGLTCVDSRAGRISQGLERGKRGFSACDNITTIFLRLDSVILMKLLSNTQSASHESICDSFSVQGMRTYCCNLLTIGTYSL